MGSTSHLRLVVIAITVALLVLWREIIDSESTIEVIETFTTSNTNVEQYATLHDAHLKGLQHHGVWIYVIKPFPTCHILLQQRTHTAFTCPGALSLLGEHTRPKEDPEETALRGLTEEMHWGSDVNITPYIIFQTRLFNYTYPNHLRDVQRTSELLILLKDEVQIEKSKLDPGEVAQAWFESVKVFRQRLREDPEAMCNTYLTKFVVEGLNTL
eukprot:PhF_6_TR40649/c0_g1_i1/m.61041